jgi:hypothetical protein
LILFSPSARLTERTTGFPSRLYARNLGLIALWQSRSAERALRRRQAFAERAARDLPAARHSALSAARQKHPEPRAPLRHQPSWPLLVNALDDRHPDIQLVALRSLGGVGRAGKLSVASGTAPCGGAKGIRVPRRCRRCRPPWPVLTYACAPALLPSLRHPDRQIRYACHGDSADDGQPRGRPPAAISPSPRSC